MSLLRISLIVAILCGIAGIVVNIGVPGTSFTGVQGSIKQKKTDLAYMTNVYTGKVRELAATNAVLKSTQAKLKQTEATLAATTEERDTALKNLDSKTKLAEKVTQERDKALRDLDDTRGELEAYKLTGWSPKEIVDFKKNYTALEASLEAVKTENTLFIKKVNTLQNKLALYENPDQPPPLPETAKGKVLVLDPKWNFVVLDVGEDKGALEGGELLVSRNGRLVAKVKVRSLQKDRCIASVVPGWQLGDVIEGDLVIPA